MLLASAIFLGHSPLRNLCRLSPGPDDQPEQRWRHHRQDCRENRLAYSARILVTRRESSPKRDDRSPVTIWFWRSYLGRTERTGRSRQSGRGSSGKSFRSPCGRDRRLGARDRRDCTDNALQILPAEKARRLPGPDLGLRLCLALRLDAVHRLILR